MESWVNVYCWQGHGHIKDQCLSPLEGQSLPPGKIQSDGRDFLGSMCKCVDGTWKSCHHSFLPPVLTAWTCCTVQVLHRPGLAKPDSLFSCMRPRGLLVYLSVIIPLPSSAVYNKQTELLGGCGSSIREPRPPDLSLLVCMSMSLSFFIPSKPQLGQYLKPFRTWHPERNQDSEHPTTGNFQYSGERGSWEEQTTEGGQT